MTKRSLSTLEKKLHLINLKSIDQLIIYSSLLAVISLPFSIGRYPLTGWSYAYTIHIICVSVVIYLALFKKRFSFNIKRYVALTCSLTMAIAGTLSFGIVGNGLLWSVFTLLLCLFFFSRKSVCLILSIILGVFAFSFHRFVVLNIPFPGNVSQYANSNIAWGLAFVGAAAFIILIGIVIMNQRQQVLQLLAEQEFQKSIIEKQKKQLAHQANHDYLTGLPSLRLANDRLEMVIQIAKRTGNKAALLFMDLDGFKAVNDNYGHDVGDHALKIVADRIRKTIRDVDTACRVGTN